MKRIVILGVILLTFALLVGAKQGGAEVNVNPEIAAIKQACLDYVEGYYESNGDRVQRGVHAELVKRSVKSGVLSTVITRDQLVSATIGKKRDKPEISVDVYDIYDGIALAKVTSGFVDYCELGKVDGRWQVIHVLWTNKLK